MPSLKALKTFCGISAAVLILSGCGGGSGSDSTSPASVSSTSGSGSSGAGSSGTGGTASSSPGSATLKWTAPTANNNGSALTNLAGYNIYYGTSASSLSHVVNITSPSTLTYVVTGLGAGTWYFAVTAYTNSGVASPMSNVGSKTIS